eukprot:Filipodium_phascolosomae@DN8097_c0_g1_i1.p1
MIIVAEALTTTANTPPLGHSSSSSSSNGGASSVEGDTSNKNPLVVTTNSSKKKKKASPTAATTTSICENPVLSQYSTHIPAEPRASILYLCSSYSKVESCCSTATDADIKSTLAKAETRAARVVAAKGLTDALYTSKHIAALNSLASAAPRPSQDKDLLRKLSRAAKDASAAWEELEELEYRSRGVFQGTLFISCAESVLQYYEEISCEACNGDLLDSGKIRGPNDSSSSSAFSSITNSISNIFT